MWRGKIHMGGVCMFQTAKNTVHYSHNYKKTSQLPKCLIGKSLMSTYL